MSDLRGKDVVWGMHGVCAGRIRNADQVVALTVDPIGIDLRYQAHAGARVTEV